VPCPRKWRRATLRSLGAETHGCMPPAGRAERGGASAWLPRAGAPCTWFMRCACMHGVCAVPAPWWGGQCRSDLNNRHTTPEGAWLSSSSHGTVAGVSNASNSTETLPAPACHPPGHAVPSVRWAFGCARGRVCRATATKGAARKHAAAAAGRLERGAVGVHRRSSKGAARARWFPCLPACTRLHMRVAHAWVHPAPRHRRTDHLSPCHKRRAIQSVPCQGRLRAGSPQAMAAEGGGLGGRGGWGASGPDGLDHVPHPRPHTPVPTCHYLFCSQQLASPVVSDLTDWRAACRPRSDGHGPHCGPPVQPA
jgi:hypothetical protein